MPRLLLLLTHLSLKLLIHLSLFCLYFLILVIDVYQSGRDAEVLLIDILDILLDIFNFILKPLDKGVILSLISLELILHLCQIFSDVFLGVLEHLLDLPGSSLPLLGLSLIIKAVFV